MNISGSKLLRAYVAITTVISVVALIVVYAFPPKSMRTDRDGVAHLTPKVEHPETGEAIDLSTLIRHYRGD